MEGGEPGDRDDSGLLEGEVRGGLSDKAQKKPNDVKDYSGSVIKCYAINKTEVWAKEKGIKELKLFPIVNHDVIKAPKVEGRSRFSRPALRLIRALILSGEKPSEFKRRLLAQDAALLAELGMDVLAAPLPPRAKIDGKLIITNI